MEKYAVVSTNNEKLASMTKLGHCSKCGAAIFGKEDNPQKTCNCKNSKVIKE